VFRCQVAGARCQGPDGGLPRLLVKWGFYVNDLFKAAQLLCLH
jgi:hypothetical protein